MAEYSSRFFKRRTWKYRTDEIGAARAIYRLWKPESVYDVGCAIGSFLEGFWLAGAKIGGCELYRTQAEQYMADAVRPHVRQLDATQAILDEEKYDLVLSVEVAEHLPETGAQTFCHNLVALAKSRIVITAAGEGQRGTGHVNCRPQRYWKDLMGVAGAEYNMIETTQLALVLSGTGDPLRIVKNLMVFHARENE